MLAGRKACKCDHQLTKHGDWRRENAEGRKEETSEDEGDSSSPNVCY